MLGKGRFFIVDVGRSDDGRLIILGLIEVCFSGSPGREGRGRVALLRGRGGSHCVTPVALLW